MTAPDAGAPAIRPIEEADIEPLAKLWHAGWQEAHAAHVPPELIALRTPESFATRLRRHRHAARTAGLVGAPLGLCIVRADEIDQLYVAPDARGTGLAAALIAEGEARIRAAGHARARLAVIPENRRAIAFYTRQGWRIAEEAIFPAETLGEPFPLPCLIMVKDLG